MRRDRRVVTTAALAAEAGRHVGHGLVEPIERAASCLPVAILDYRLALLPFAILFSPAQALGAGTIFSLLALGLLCTASAFILFFDLLKRNGATAATTVTFVIPVFGILWGSLFLAEEIFYPLTNVFRRAHPYHVTFHDLLQG